MNIYHCVQTRGWNDCSKDAPHSLSAIAYFYGESLSRQLQKPVGLIVNPMGGTSEYCWIERRILQRECPEILTDWYINQKVTVWMKERVILNLGKTVRIIGNCTFIIRVIVLKHLFVRSRIMP